MTVDPNRCSPDNRFVRNWPLLLAIHVVALILIRTLVNADDFNNWDLIPFLNANATSSIWMLVQRPEVHFLSPLSFPLYATGAESVLSAVLFRVFGGISLYWSNIFVLIIYDVVFFFLLYKLLKLILPTRTGQSLFWLLLAMSPVVLTFASTSAFNMQGYCVILIGILGLEVLRVERFKGAVLLALAFLFIAQGYGIAFFLPYYLLVWLIWSLGFHSLDHGNSQNDATTESFLLPAILSLALITVLAFGVNYASHGVYFAKISPVDPHEAGNVLSSVSDLLTRMQFFVRQSFYPETKADGVSVGFAPYFVYLTLISGIMLLVLEGIFRVGRVTRFLKTAMTKPSWWFFGIASFLLVAFGYLPGYLNPIMKSQRVVFGDIFLIIVIAAVCSRVNWNQFPRARNFSILAALLLLLSDAYYLSHSTFIDHSYNHYPVFDFDLSDSRVRHDLIAASKVMKRQTRDENSLIVLDYPRSYSENTTDPGLFFAHLLRHFGRFATSDRLIIPYQWCDFRYGCPFPEVIGRSCDFGGCYESPENEMQIALEAGKNVIVWRWSDSPAPPPPYLSRFETMAKDDVLEPQLKASATGWTVYEILPKTRG